MQKLRHRVESNLPMVTPAVSDGASTVSLVSRVLVTFGGVGVSGGLMILQVALTPVFPQGPEDLKPACV